MLKIKTYNGQTADFYIQSKGLHAGRPMKSPIPNCFAVWSEKPNAFEIVEIIWIAKRFEYFITGSVIPFIRLSEIRPFLLQMFEREFDKKKLNAVKTARELEVNSRKKLKMCRLLKLALANKTIKQAR